MFQLVFLGSTIVIVVLASPDRNRHGSNEDIDNFPKIGCLLKSTSFNETDETKNGRPLRMSRNALRSLSNMTKSHQFNDDNNDTHLLLYDHANNNWFNLQDYFTNDEIYNVAFATFNRDPSNQSNNNRPGTEWYNCRLVRPCFSVVCALSLVYAIVRRLKKKNRMPSKWIIAKDSVRYDDSEKLGHGYTSNVFQGVMKTSFLKKRNVAVKKPRSSIEPKYLEMEIASLCLINNRHPSIVTFYGIVPSATPGEGDCMVLELAKGNLRDHIRGLNAVEFEVDFALSACRQIISGMAFITSLNIIHRDLAARNILLTFKMHVKISDFGLSCRADPETNEYISKTTFQPSESLPTKWLAIEALTEGRFSEKSDIWSFGVLLYEIFSLGQVPYDGFKHGDLLTFLLDGNRLPQPEMATDKIYQIMNLCWLADRSLRPSFHSLNSADLSDYGYAKIYKTTSLYNIL